MVSEEDFKYVCGRLAKLQDQVDVLEAYQRNAESGTTACSAAGGGIEQVKTARSAGREPCQFEGVVAWIKERIELNTNFIEDRGTKNVDLFRGGNSDLRELIVFIEARRGDAGCVEPPAG